MNTLTLVHQLMDFIKYQTNLEKNYSIENINRLFKIFCESNQVTCKQTLILKPGPGITKSLMTNDGKPISFYKNNLILP